MYTFDVSPDSKSPGHHILLDDGETKIGLIPIDGQMRPDPKAIGSNPVERSSLKTSSGNQKYSDLEPPYAALAQYDWSGGRASPEFEIDTTKYADGNRVNTERANRVILGGRESYCTGLRTAQEEHQPGGITATGLKLVPLIGSKTKLSRRFYAMATANRNQVYAWLRYVGEPHGDLTIAIYNDNGSGAIGTIKTSVTVAVSDLREPLVSEHVWKSITSLSYTLGTAYWFTLEANIEDDEDNHWEAGCEPLTNKTYQNNGVDATWDASDVDLYFRIMYSGTGHPGKFFQYKRVEYFVTKPEDGVTAAQLYMNGDRGTADSNSGQLDKLVDASKTWTTDEWVGCVVVVIGGPGATEAQNWRYITANNSTELTVDTAWKVAHTTATEYVILGSLKWTEITGHGLTAPVTDVLVSSQNVVYFCQGEDAYIRRMREYTSAGVWTRDFAADSTSKAIFLQEYNAPPGMRVVRSNGDMTISKASIATPVWGTDLTWSTAKAVGDSWDRITALARYADSTQEEAIWVMKEAGPWVYRQLDDSPTYTEWLDRVKIPQMRQVMSEKNGRAWGLLDVYIYFSMMNSVHRFYHPQLDDVGPTSDEGLPADRQGPIVAITTYPGRVFISIDAGANYSSILANTGGASYHELYRAPKNRRIMATDFQPIPGNLPDRLWVKQAQDILCLPFPSDNFDPYQDPYFPYTHEGVLEMSPMYAGLQDAWKYWKSLKLHATNLLEDSGTQLTWFEADYRLEDETEWTPIDYKFKVTPVDETEFDADQGISGKKIQPRTRLYSIDPYETPKLLAAIINAVSVTEPKFVYSFSAMVGTKDLNSVMMTDLTPEEMVRKLNEWAGTARPLKMSCTNRLYDGNMVFLQPVPSRPFLAAERVDQFTYLVTINLQEA